MEKYCIYIHKNKINNKIYVGQTKNIKERWKPSAYDNCSKFYNAIQKYGWENFEHIILEEGLTLEEANLKETYYIRQYNSVEEGYNLNYGGNNKNIIAEETKQKLSEISLSLWNNQEYRQKQQEARLQSWQDNEDRKQKASKVMRATFSKKIYCITTNEYFDAMRDAELKYGIHHSGISACCQGKRKSAGKHPETGEKMIWRYVNDDK